MYKILGGDGKEYGPVTAETLRQWVKEGRANRQTRVWVEGSAKWQELSSVAEFASLFEMPPLGMNAAVGGAPIGPAPTSGMAITSLVMGILGLPTCGITTIPGLVLGLVAMKRVRSSQGRLGGHGLALAGTIVSGAVLGLMLLLILPALFLPALAKAKAKAQSINCVNNMKQLGLAALIYSSDNNDVLPVATNWCDALTTYAGSPAVFQCPGDAAQLRSGYALNAAVSGMDVDDIPPDTVLFFECDSGWNASGGQELLVSQARHADVFVFCLVDGSVQQIRSNRLSQLRWDPGDKTNN